MLRYLSICSGIEAATVAWHPLGWKAAGFAEIDRFPSAVLAHHFPNIENFGDFTQIKETNVGSIDLLVGGTPCQDFSIAGLRSGLAGDRGNLSIEFLRLAQRLRPRWLVWENVPGVLSQNGGRDFGAILGGMVECGYGFFYRVFDAQYFGLAQRRKRVFVVGYLGDWRPAAAVLLERESLSGNSSPRRKAGKDIAPTISARTKGGGGLGTDFELDGGLIAKTVGTLNTGNGRTRPGDTLQCALAGHVLAFGGNNTSGAVDISTACNAQPGSRIDFESETFVVSSCKDHGALAACDRHAVAFHENQRGELTVNNTAGSLKVGGGKPGQGYPAVAISLRGREGGATAELSGEQTPALRASQGGGDKAHILADYAVRRLTPRECERLQGFPDNYTLIPYRNGMAKDGPRYKALGNSMAVPVMCWIGERLAAVETLLCAHNCAGG